MSTIRAGGVTTISVDKLTKGKYLQLAGTMPLYEYMADLAKRELLGKQGGLGLRREATREASLVSVKADTSQLVGMVSLIVSRLLYTVPPEERSEFYAAIGRDTAEGVKSLVDKVRGRSLSDKSQGELALE